MFTPSAHLDQNDESSNSDEQKKCNMRQKLVGITQSALAMEDTVHSSPPR